MCIEERQAKRKITSIKNHLISLGASFLNDSKNSNSIYLKLDNDKIRVSDHSNVGGTVVKMNIIVPINSNEIILFMDTVPMIYESLKELKIFLKSWVLFKHCVVFSKKSITTNALSAQKDKLTKITQQIKKERKSLDVIKTIKTLNLEGLTEKQVNGVIKTINSYHENNKINSANQNNFQ